MKKVLTHILVVIFLISSLFVCNLSVSAGKTEIRRSIAIVFDNSGSMYVKGEKAWCRATYAMEVFASMLNKGDSLSIHPMNPIEVNGQKYTMDSPFIITDPNQASQIREIYTENAQDTHIETIDAAIKQLSSSQTTNNYMIVLTDGQVFYENGKELSTFETEKKLSERFNKCIVANLSTAETVSTSLGMLGAVLVILAVALVVTLIVLKLPLREAVMGECEIPATYSLSVNEEGFDFDKSIFIIEDSQLDIGLLVAVERNLDRIMQIISDYLAWNQEKIECKEEQVAITDVEPEKKEQTTSEIAEPEKKEQTTSETTEGEDVSAETDATEEKLPKNNPFAKVGGWFMSKFKKPKKDPESEEASNEEIFGAESEKKAEVVCSE